MAVRASESPSTLWSWRELADAVHGALLDVGEAGINEQVAVAVLHPEGVRARPHSGVGLHEVPGKRPVPDWDPTGP